MCYDYAMDWPLLAPLNQDERAAVLAAARRRSFAKGEVVFHEGDPSDSMHLVVSGHLAVRVSTPDGERATLNVLSAGDIVGELSLLQREGTHQRSASVLALEATETLVLSARAFRELCDRHPGVQRLVADMLAVRVRELSGRLLETMYVGLDRRLYRCLLDLAEVYGSGSGDPVIPLTQDHLADLVGGTRPSVNQVLQRLLAQGIIELGRGRVVLRDVGALRGKAART
jgi:CRP/FNR family cyclic AMP-dependent transcriptional regulator